MARPAVDRVPHTWPRREVVSVSDVASLDPSAATALAAARYHGDQAAEPGMLDFAVNVRHAQPPAWLVQRLAARLPDLAHYPGADDERAAIQAVADRHGRERDEVALLTGAAEGFALLPNLRPTLAAVIAPSFTEPAMALRSAGVRVQHVVLDRPFGLAGAQVADDADLVVVGNPTNPTSVLHSREQILALRRPGRIVVVDEAFADSVPGEPESLADDPRPDVLVLRSLTKTWSLAGLRVGYALGAPEVLARLTAQRAHWPVGTLQLTAIAVCCAPDAVAEAAVGAGRRCAPRWCPACGQRVSNQSMVVHHSSCSPFRMPNWCESTCTPVESPCGDVIRSSAWTDGICGLRSDLSGRCSSRRSPTWRRVGHFDDSAAGRGHRRAGRRLPASACPVVGFGWPGLRRSRRRAELGDDRSRRHGCGGR